MDPIIIKLNKNKVALVMLMCAAFIALGFWLMTKEPNHGESLTSSDKTRVIGIVNLCLFGLLFIVFLIRLMDKTPGVVLDDKGIHTNTTVFVKKFFSWNEITDIQAGTLGKKQVIFISHGKPKDFPLMNTTLACTFDELEEKVMKAWKEQGGLTGEPKKRR